jgi:hypothetical protein
MAARATVERGGVDRDMTPAQWYALIFGIVLTLVGIIGFFVSSDFSTGGNPPGDTLLGFEVNGWHNIVHLLSGLVGLAVFRNRLLSRQYALGFGVIYLIVFVYGIIASTNIIHLLALNGADNVLHLVIGLAGVAAGIASRSDEVATR